MEARYKPLKVSIPLEYADLLGCSRGHISHINKGRKRLRDDQVHLLLEKIDKDPRLEGLTVLHLRQELVQWLPAICSLCPRDQKRQDKKKARRTRD